MKNSEAVMEHLTVGTRALSLHKVICIFQDFANYKELLAASLAAQLEEHLVELNLRSISWSSI